MTAIRTKTGRANMTKAHRGQHPTISTRTASQIDIIGHLNSMRIGTQSERNWALVTAVADRPKDQAASSGILNSLQQMSLPMLSGQSATQQEKSLWIL